ncbi:MAG: ribonuclease HII [Candidatus Pacebacteria bacterium]|nr:ribonuclease HII [Candidatus Paceibacterota bacterium]
MIIPDFSREEKLSRKGYKYIAGVDEAGRGPLAGPVVAAAVVFLDNKNINKLIKKGVRDSKTLSMKKREYFYELIIEQSQDWAVGDVSEEIIDKINILEATKLAMRKAVENLKNKPDFILVDGINTIEDFPASQIAIPKADQFIFSVSAASIIAKVTRDRILMDFDKQYPGYGFAAHKGYGTKFHMEMIKKMGPCKIHRRSFKPIGELFSNFLKKNINEID